MSGSPFKLSNKPYDWLGAGAYFWEDDVERAYAWARERRPLAPCVVGAVIELGNCLDLTKQSGIRIVEFAFKSYVELQERSGQAVPRNEPGRDSKPSDLVLRLLDSAVIDHLHSIYDKASQVDGGNNRKFDTVRAMFPEGKAIYEGAGFLEKTHVQIAVRRPEQILGVFRIPQHQMRRLGLPDFYSF